MVARIHGMDGTVEYRTWIDMKRRCHQPQRPDYKRYGARGIYVCDRWRFGESGISGFVLFLQDMGKRPSPAHSIERKNNDGPYSPENCTWETKTVQGRNTRTNVFVEFQGRCVSLKEAAEMAGINYQTVFSRINLYGWSVEDALSKDRLEPGRTLTGNRKRKTVLKISSLDPSSYKLVAGKKPSQRYTVRENLLRLVAKRHGLLLEKSRARDLMAPTYCKYTILNSASRETCAGRGFTMTLRDVASHLAKLS